jgi:hypothetical protein
MVVTILTVGLILPLFMTMGGAEYTTPIVWSNKKEYDPSEMAYLYGYGFKPSTQVTITIVRPDLVEDTVLTPTDQFGYFSCQYLLDGIHGTFNVTATDGVNVATTTFDNALSLNASWDSHDSIYIYSQTSGLSTSKSYYINYSDPAGVVRRQSPTYTGVKSFTDKLTILPTFPNIFGWWTVKLYENGLLKRTTTVYIDKIVWTTDSTYTTLVTSFARGETVYFKTMGLKPSKYYRFKLEMPNGTMFYVGSSWTTGVSTMTGSHLLPSTAPLGTWTLHVREADDASGTCEHHYADCCFEVTTAPPPQQYYLTVRTDPPSIGTIPGQGWYNACTVVNLTAPEQFPGSTGTRYRFYYWDVNGASQGAGVYEIAVTMDANKTATAHYITQYFLNLTTSPSGVTTPAGVDWYDAGTSASIFAPQFVGITPEASRYKFVNWTTADMSEIADPYAISTTVLMDKPKTVTANYVVQYNITFSQVGVGSDFTGTIVTIDSNNYNVLPVSFWWDASSSHLFSYQSPLVVSPNAKRYVWNFTSGLSDKQSNSLTVTTNGSVIGNYKTQYYLTVISPYGTTGGAEYYYSGDTAYATLDVGIIDHGNGTRRVFTNWNGDASGTNYAQSNSISMNGPKTATANWKTQFKLTIHTSGLGTKVTNVYNGTNILGTATDVTPYVGWFDQNALLNLDIDSPIYGSPTAYVFANWTGDATGSGRPLSVTMNSPKDITANYKTQYEVTFTQTGLDSSANSIVVTVNGIPKTFGELPYTILIDSGTVITYSYSNVSSSTTGKRFNLTGVTGPASPITVTSSVTVNGEYKTQFQITFNQSGVNTDFTGTVVTIDGIGYTVSTLPASFWWDNCSTHTFTFQSPLVVTSNAKQYVWKSTTGLSTLQSGSIKVSTSGSVTGNSMAQYYLTVSSPSGYGSPTPTSGWFDTGTPITASVTSPWSGPTGTRYICNGWTGTGSVSGSGSAPTVSFTINQPSSITWSWKTQYYIIVKTDPTGITTIPGEGWYNESTSATLTAPTVTNYQFNYWDVDGTSQGSEVNPITINNINAPHTATAHYTYVPPQLSVSISPRSASIHVGQSVIFMSTVSGGTSPYRYQWYLDGAEVSGATLSSWTYTPTSASIHYVKLKVTDSKDNIAESDLAQVLVRETGPAVGGYSVSLTRLTPTAQLASYMMLIALFGATLSLTRRKRK